MKKQWTTVFLIFIALMVVWFAVLNVDPVIINFGFASLEMPLAIVLIVTLLIGVLMAVLLSTSIILRYKRDEKKLVKEKEQLIQNHQTELKTLEQKNNDLKKDIRQLNRRLKNIDANQHTEIEE